MPCYQGCFSCQNSTSCLSCITGYSTQADGRCHTNCLTTEYRDTSTYECVACPLYCNNCTATGCVKCNTGYFMDGTGVCGTGCGVGYYGNSTSRTCIACIANCISCTNNTKCVTCSSGYELYTDYLCYVPCLSTGQYRNSSTKSCSNCISNCQSCNSTTKCLTCAQNY